MSSKHSTDTDITRRQRHLKLRPNGTIQMSLLLLFFIIIVIVIINAFNQLGQYANSPCNRAF